MWSLDNLKDRLAIARRSLKDRIVTIVSLTRVFVSCVIGVWLGCISVVPTTVRESASPDSEGNKQTDAGNCLFSKSFSVRRVVVEFFHQISVKVYIILIMYNGNV